MQRTQIIHQGKDQEPCDFTNTSRNPVLAKSSQPENAQASTDGTNFAPDAFITLQEGNQIVNVPLKDYRHCIALDNLELSAGKSVIVSAQTRIRSDKAKN